ncbi:MAG TPA: histidine--tRNA ligase, partial [Candidatus Sulfotelmatobacter sp.]|nr:histidine--tRNA ligase [Candidatus Sulfotelmatobacter sp.]
MVNVQTLKGFRDFLPQEVRKREYVLNTLKKVFESYGFEPLETPSLEYEELLTGKYGDEGDKLMYKFKDNGDRNVALRYDQTVPLARVVAQYQNELPMPFMRYQIQNVWRAENTQKGRYREFLQIDADIVGTNSSRADVQVITTAVSGLYTLGIKNLKVILNDREIFSETGKMVRQKFPNLIKKQIDLFLSITGSVDKIKKIGEEKVVEELISKGFSRDEAKYCLNIVTRQKPTEKLLEILNTLNFIRFPEGIEFEFSPTLARGLNYYTSTIFEIEINGYSSGSVAGGGRYDNLIGTFTKYNEQISAVGFSYGFDRLMEAIEELGI